MKRLILHIGGHKTGSTYLQMLFASARLEKAGIFYPKTGRNLLYGHHNLVSALRTKIDLNTLLNELIEEISHHDGDVLLSSENFEYLSAHHIRTLLSRFKNYDPLIVYYFRAWPQLVPSMWQEEIKHGSDQVYQSYLLSHIFKPFSSPLLNPNIPVSRFVEAVGQKRVRVISYDLATNKLGVGHAFSEAMGLDPNLLSDTTRINESFSPYLVETIRNMNAILKKRGYEPTYHIKNKFIQDALRKEGRDIQEHINNIMAEYCIDAPALEGSRAFKEVYNEFFQKQALTMHERLSESRDAVFQSVTTHKLVDQSFMRERAASELLAAMADRVETALQA